MAGNASISTALSVLLGKSQTWLFDSACCNHVTPHSSLFSKLDPGCIVQDLRTGQEFGTGPRVGRMFPVDNLHLPPVALVFVAAATDVVSSLPSLALWHSRLGHASSSRVQQLTSRGLLGSVSKKIFEIGRAHV